MTLSSELFMAILGPVKQARELLDPEEERRLLLDILQAVWMRWFYLERKTAGGTAPERTAAPGQAGPRPGISDSRSQIADSEAAPPADDATPD